MTIFPSDIERYKKEDKALYKEFQSFDFPDDFYGYVRAFYRKKYKYLLNPTPDNRLPMLVAYQTVHSDLKGFQVRHFFSMEQLHAYASRLQTGLGDLDD